MLRRARAIALACASVAAAALTAASAASAGVLVTSATDCDDQSLAQVFLPWADIASYTLAPQGAFEGDTNGWDLENGATTVAGNEPWNVHDAADTTSLSLPSGSRATSGAMCVGIEHPTLRFFVKRSGGTLLSSLKVDALTETATGDVIAVPVGVVTGTGSWSPTAPLPIASSLLPLLPGERTAVAFRFTPIGSADWTIDDVYVDPWRRG